MMARMEPKAFDTVLQLWSFFLRKAALSGASRLENLRVHRCFLAWLCFWICAHLCVLLKLFNFQANKLMLCYVVICTMSYLLIWFKSLQKNRLNIGEDLFFGDHLILTEKPHQCNSRLMKIWINSFTDVSSFQKSPPPLRNPGYATAQDGGKLRLSNTLRIGP